MIAIVFVAGIATSCKSNDSKSESTEELVERVWQFSLSHPEGFTIDIRTMEESTEGIAVSYAATQGCHSRDSLKFVITHALEHDGYVGGWLDSESGFYYFDSTKLFPEDQMEEALKFAYENGQLAIFILSTGEEIRLDKMRMAAW